jgi:hypothetical protein
MWAMIRLSRGERVRVRGEKSEGDDPKRLK